VVSTGSADGADELEVVPGRVTWRLSGDLGRRYAAVSGDHNPIHLYPLTAKALGFPRQIAHGMWSLARCVAALENRLPDAVTVEAAFKKPIFLPGTVAFGQEPVRGGTGGTDDGIVFALTSPKSGAPHLVGRIQRAR
jgi:acyl dehydratase